ncbi:MAG TPA: ABC transporter ATP-binding protein, partial [Paracoccaceae bacterium]|nr:ABC transporter ATP-binding protein [Paracoccaceae bacterium]
PRPPAPPAPAPAASRGAADALLGGVSVADLVARAAEDSRARVTATPGPASAPARPRMPAPPAAAPSLGAGQDRLSSALREIEEAAARARAWRPDPPRHR